MNHTITCPRCKATLATVRLPDNLSPEQLAFRLSGYACGDCNIPGVEENKSGNSAD